MVRIHHKVAIPCENFGFDSTPLILKTTEADLLGKTLSASTVGYLERELGTQPGVACICLAVLCDDVVITEDSIRPRATHIHYTCACWVMVTLFERNVTLPMLVTKILPHGGFEATTSIISTITGSGTTAREDACGNISSFVLDPDSGQLVDTWANPPPECMSQGPAPYGGHPAHISVGSVVHQAISSKPTGGQTLTAWAHFSHSVHGPVDSEVLSEKWTREMGP